MAKEMIIEKSVLIHKPAREVFDFLRITRNQEKFSVWNMKDLTKETTTRGIDGTEGFVYSWNSKDKSVGAGSQQITKIVDGQRIEYSLIFERPMKNTGTSQFVIDSDTLDQTRVTWKFTGPTKFPMSLFAGFIKKMLAKDISKSLDNLKTRLEE